MEKIIFMGRGQAFFGKRTDCNKYLKSNHTFKTIGRCSPVVGILRAVPLSDTR